MQNKIWKTLVIGVILIGSIQHSFGQIGHSRSEIIKEKGYDYESGTTDDGTKYISYEEDVTTEQSGTYTQLKVIYFITTDDGTETCVGYRILEPSSETNTNVALLKKSFVEIDYMKWKDYEKEIIYTIEVKEGVCILTASFDFEKQ